MDRASNIMGNEVRRLRLLKHTLQGQDRAAIVRIAPGVCPLCKGAGYTRTDVQPGHQQFGKAGLTACACKIAAMKERQQEDLVQLSGIMSLSKFKNATFDTFSQRVPNVGGAFIAARQYASLPMGWLVLTGDPGCGKTHLAVAIARHRIEAGDTVLIQTVPDLLDHLRAAFNPSIEQSYDQRFDEMKDAELLILDDYGAQQDTTWANEKLFQLMNYRYNASLPTVVTSNDTNLLNVDPRVKSRLCDIELARWIKIENVRDYRMNGKGGV